MPCRRKVWPQFTFLKTRTNKNNDGHCEIRYELPLKRLIIDLKPFFEWQIAF